MEEDLCVICQELLKKRGILTCCDHRFCFDCIVAWAKVTNCCPLCKERFENVQNEDGGEVVPIARADPVLSEDEAGDAELAAELAGGDDVWAVIEGYDLEDPFINDAEELEEIPEGEEDLWVVRQASSITNARIQGERGERRSARLSLAHPRRQQRHSALEEIRRYRERERRRAQEMVSTTPPQPQRRRVLRRMALPSSSPEGFSDASPLEQGDCSPSKSERRAAALSRVLGGTTTVPKQSPIPSGQRSTQEESPKMSRNVQSMLDMARWHHSQQSQATPKVSYISRYFVGSPKSQRVPETPQRRSNVSLDSRTRPGRMARPRSPRLSVGGREGRGSLVRTSEVGRHIERGSQIRTSEVGRHIGREEDRRRKVEVRQKRDRENDKHVSEKQRAVVMDEQEQQIQKQLAVNHVKRLLDGALRHGHMDRPSFKRAVRSATQEYIDEMVREKRQHPWEHTLSPQRKRRLAQIVANVPCVVAMREKLEQKR